MLCVCYVVTLFALLHVACASRTSARFAYYSVELGSGQLADRSACQTLCQQRHVGGYLATITSSIENERVFRSLSLTTRVALLGAERTSASPGAFRWTAGPLAGADDGRGQVFWEGVTAIANGFCSPRAYCSFASNTPNGTYARSTTLVFMYGAAGLFPGMWDDGVGTDWGSSQDALQACACRRSATETLTNSLSESFSQMVFSLSRSVSMSPQLTMSNTENKGRIVASYWLVKTTSATSAETCTALCLASRDGGHPARITSAGENSLLVMSMPPHASAVTLGGSRAAGSTEFEWWDIAAAGEPRRPFFDWNTTSNDASDCTLYCNFAFVTVPVQQSANIVMYGASNGNASLIGQWADAAAAAVTDGCACQAFTFVTYTKASRSRTLSFSNVATLSATNNKGRNRATYWFAAAAAPTRLVCMQRCALRYGFPAYVTSDGENMVLLRSMPLNVTSALLGATRSSDSQTFRWTGGELGSRDSGAGQPFLVLNLSSSTSTVTCLLYCHFKDGSPSSTPDTTEVFLNGPAATNPGTWEDVPAASGSVQGCACMRIQFFTWTIPSDTRTTTNDATATHSMSADPPSTTATWSSSVNQSRSSSNSATSEASASASPVVSVSATPSSSAPLSSHSASDSGSLTESLSVSVQTFSRHSTNSSSYSPTTSRSLTAATSVSGTFSTTNLSSSSVSFDATSSTTSTFSHLTLGVSSTTSGSLNVTKSVSDTFSVTNLSSSSWSLTFTVSSSNSSFFTQTTSITLSQSRTLPKMTESMSASQTCEAGACPVTSLSLCCVPSGVSNRSLSVLGVGEMFCMSSFIGSALGRPLGSPLSFDDVLLCSEVSGWVLKVNTTCASNGPVSRLLGGELIAPQRQMFHLATVTSDASAAEVKILSVFSDNDTAAPLSWIRALSPYRKATLRFKFMFYCGADEVGSAAEVDVSVTPLPLPDVVIAARRLGSALSVVSAFGLSSSAAAIGRVSAARQVLLCSPTGISSGGLLSLAVQRSDEYESELPSVRGAIVGNWVATLGAVVVMTAVAGIYVGLTGTSYRAACLRIGLPSTILPVFTIASPSTAGAVSYLLYVAPALDDVDLVVLGSGAVHLVLFLAPLIASHWFVVTKMQHMRVSRDLPPTHRTHLSSLLYRLRNGFRRVAYRTVVWVLRSTYHSFPSNALPDRLRRISAVEAAKFVTQEYAWLPLAGIDAVTLVSTGVVAAVSGLGSTTFCQGVAIGLLAQSVALVALYVVLRPSFTSLFSRVFAVVTVGGCALSLVFQTAFTLKNNDADAEQLDRDTVASARWLMVAASVFDVLVLGVSVFKIICVDGPKFVVALYSLVLETIQLRREHLRAKGVESIHDGGTIFLQNVADLLHLVGAGDRELSGDAIRLNPDELRDNDDCWGLEDPHLQGAFWSDDGQAKQKEDASEMSVIRQTQIGMFDVFTISQQPSSERSLLMDWS